MHSMTGFGQAAAGNERYRMTVTLRSVNHRFLDLSLRGLEELRKLEPEIRELLSGRLTRGRLEATFALVPTGPRHTEISVDENLVQTLRALCDDLAGRGLITSKLELGDLLRLPQALELQVRDPEWRPEDRELLFRLGGEALDQLVASRAGEGSKLQQALRERCDGLDEVLGELRRLHAGKAKETASRLRQRISELLEGEMPDQDRMAQEVALLVDRGDIAEELDRLDAHLGQFRSILAHTGSVGKRLDFLAQEILRELNTVGAKCRDSDMIRSVVEGKVHCEQIREQVQNVE